MPVLDSTAQREKEDVRSQRDQVGAHHTTSLNTTSITHSTHARSELQRELAGQRSTPPADNQNQTHSQQPTNQAADPRVQQMQEQQRALQEDIERQRSLISGTESNIALSRKEAEAGGVTGFFLWTSGASGAMQKDIASMQELNKARTDQLTRMTSELERQKTALNEFSKLEQQGRELQDKGDLAGAQKAFNEAQKVFTTSIETEQVGVLVTNASYKAAQRQVSEELKGSIKTLDDTETVLRTTQKVAVIAGATIATGGAAGAVVASYGVVGSAAVGVVAGTTYGTAVGAASAYSEATGHYVHGNKTWKQASADALQQTGEFSRDSAIASVGTLAGMGVGGQVGNGVAARFVSQAGGKALTTGQKIIVGAANGASAGATNAAVTTTANTSIEYAAANREFSERYKGSDLSAREQQKLYSQFMKERGLTASGIAKRFAHDVGVGALGGAIGGGIGAGKEIAPSTSRAVLSLEGGQLAADFGIGLGDAALSGQFNAQGISSSISGAVVGSVTGRISQSNKKNIGPLQDGDLTPPPSIATDESPPEIFHFDNYHKDRAEKQTYPQQIRPAAGAELMSADQYGHALPNEVLQAKDAPLPTITFDRKNITRVNKTTSLSDAEKIVIKDEPQSASPAASDTRKNIPTEPDTDTIIAKKRFNQDPVVPITSNRPIPISDPHVAAQKIAEITGGPLPPVGKPFLILPEFIRWTQNSIDHRSRNGDYTVIETGDAMAAKGEVNLKPNRLPAIMLFVDTEGRIWSHDNRRLASAILGDSPVNAQIMSEKRVETEAMRHYSTQTDGTSVEVFHSDTRERLGQIINQKLIKREAK